MSQIIEQRIATLLGNLGLIPLYALSAATWAPFGAPYERFVEQALVGYAAVIVSFLGAVHWGLALATPALNKAQARSAFGWGVVPAAPAWLALLLAVGGVHVGFVHAVWAAIRRSAVPSTRRCCACMGPCRRGIPRCARG